MKSNQITKSLAFSKKKKKKPHPNILWIKPLYYILLRKPIFITWNVERERKRDADFLNIQVTKCKKKKDNKRQKKERIDK